MTPSGADTELRIALMLPCLDEELTLAKVIRDFRSAIPNLEVYVFDNGSTDRSVDIAHAEKVTVVKVSQRGKGNVVQKMFELVEADVYIMADSDDTYDASAAMTLIQPIVDGDADMVVATRLSDYSIRAFRKFHHIGNQLILGLINLIFEGNLSDACSGYRVMSDYFVRNIPLLRGGFEVETELTVYSLMNGFTIKEIPVPYRNRPKNSFSKLNTYRDGYKILKTIARLGCELKPFPFLSIPSVFCFVAAVLLSVIEEPQAAFFSNFLSLLSVSLLASGLVLNALTAKLSELQVLDRRRAQQKRVCSLPQKRKKSGPMSLAS